MNENFHGRLFSTLRLPILTHQPVHIHGLFSVAPDRARLSSSGQSPGYDDLATKWNQHLFTHCASIAWVKLLVHQSANGLSKDNYGLWPRADLSRTDIWSTLDDSVIDLVIKDNLPIWNTVNGCCVAFDQGMFSCIRGEAEKYATALAQAKVPVVYLASPLLIRVKERAACLVKNINLLNPGAVRDFLREQGISSGSKDTYAQLLEYCLLDAGKSGLGAKHGSAVFADLCGVDIWPTVSGPITRLSQQPLFLPRDKAEMQLFINAQSLRTLDIDHLSPLALSIILENMTSLSSLIRFRTISDLSIDWPLMYPLATSSDSSSDCSRRLEGLDHLVNGIWMWIIARSKEEKLESFQSSLYDQKLIPINDSRIRRLGTKEYMIPALIVEKSDPLSDVLTSITSQNPGLTAPMLDTHLLTSEVVKSLRKKAKNAKDLHLTCPDHLETFMEWLVGGKEMLAIASPQQKEILLMHIEKLLRSRSHLEQLAPDLANFMKKLPLFKKSKSTAPFR